MSSLKVPLIRPRLVRRKTPVPSQYGKKELRKRGPRPRLTRLSEMEAQTGDAQPDPHGEERSSLLLC